MSCGSALRVDEGGFQRRIYRSKHSPTLVPQVMSEDVLLEGVRVRAGMRKCIELEEFVARSLQTEACYCRWVMTVAPKGY